MTAVGTSATSAHVRFKAAFGGKTDLSWLAVGSRLRAHRQNSERRDEASRRGSRVLAPAPAGRRGIGETGRVVAPFVARGSGPLLPHATTRRLHAATPRYQ